jgi:hypothetical protein
MSRENFAQILTELKALSLTEVQNKCQEAFETEVRATWQAKYPRRRKFDLKRGMKDLGIDAYMAIRERYEALAEEAYQEWKAQRKALESKLEGLAKDLSVERGEEWTLWRTVWSSTYSSQGFGAISYAKNSAEMHADYARFQEIPVRIEREDRAPSGGVGGRISHADFKVFVQCSELDLEILARKPGPSLREQVRLAWKRGINPRVFNPFLPHGYEEKEGLDFFGNDLRAG